MSQGLLPSIFKVVFRGIDRKAKTVLALTFSPDIESTSVLNLLANSYSKLHISDKEQLLYLSLVCLLFCDKAFPNMIEAVLQEDVL